MGVTRSESRFGPETFPTGTSPLTMIDVRGFWCGIAFERRDVNHRSGRGARRPHSLLNLPLFRFQGALLLRWHTSPEGDVRATVPFGRRRMRPVPLGVYPLGT